MGLGKGSKRQRAITKTILTDLIQENLAQEMTEKTRSSMGDVVMFSGCKDNQTSADTNIDGYGFTGASSYAFVCALRKGGKPTYIEVLATMRDILKEDYSQIVQMSTG